MANIINTVFAVAVASVICWLVNWRIYNWWQNNPSFAIKHKLQPQDFHKKDAPRTGGIGLFVGIAAGLLWLEWSFFPLLFIICLLPAFLAGIFEDLINYEVPPSLRLLITMLSGVLSIWLLDLSFDRTDIYFLDQFVADSAFFSWFCIIIVVAGAAHSTNVIDGFNGLMPGYGMFACLPFIWLCWQFGDYDMMAVFIVLFAALAGLFVTNFPQGKIFSGDSGAYLLGVTLSLAAMLTLQRNPAISPWFPMVIMSYPVGETIFSILRKRLILGKPAMQPDEYHLHMIIHQLIDKRYETRQKNQQEQAKEKPVQQISKVNTNAMTSPWLWLLTIVPSIGAIAYPTDTKVLIIICFAYASIYILLYVILLMRSLAIISR